MGSVTRVSAPVWLDATRSLQQFGEALGIRAVEWPVLERLGSVECRDREISRETVVALDASLVQSACAFYADSLRATIRFANDDELLLSSTLEYSDIERFLDETAGNPTYDLELTLDKDALITAWWGQRPGCRSFLFLFEPVLEALLNQDLGQVEHTFFPTGQGEKAIFILPEREIFLDGPHLALVGGTALIDWESILPTAAVEDERAQRIYEDCRKNLTWQREWVQHLTPFHLALLRPQAAEGTADSSETAGRIVDLLHIHYANLALLFTAQRSEVGTPEIVSVYASASRVIRVPHRLPSAPVHEEEHHGSYDLLAILSWAYDQFGQESRLALVQDIFVRELLAVDEPERGSALQRRSPTILAQLHWSWQSFVGDRVDAYLAQVREFESDVDRTVQGFADQLAALIKSLTDTMLGAVAAVLAALVAAAVNDVFRLEIFALAVAAYAIYVFVFHVRFGLQFQRERFQALKDDFETRKRWFEERVPPEQVMKIVGDRIEESQTRWTRWYRTTKRAYWGLLIVLVLSVVAAGVVDAAGADSRDTVATPTVVQNPAKSPQTATLPPMPK
jgi:hypothetical protein